MTQSADYQPDGKKSEIVVKDGVCLLNDKCEMTTQHMIESVSK